MSEGVPVGGWDFGLLVPYDGYYTSMCHRRPESITVRQPDRVAVTHGTSGEPSRRGPTTLTRTGTIPELSRIRVHVHLMMNNVSISWDSRIIYCFD